MATMVEKLKITATATTTATVALVTQTTIHLARAELFHMDGQTQVMKLIVSFLFVLRRR
jgi:hypothetical protein